MSDVATGSHLSIGEVLSLVQEDFPDVTISKIRFLESQGLIAPERTASGYRKFYEADIDRLRWILAQQRDHFLPLKVIKRMLDEGVDVADGDSAQPSLFSTSPDDPGAATPPSAPGAGPGDPPAAHGSAEGDGTAPAPDPGTGAAGAPSAGGSSRSPAHPAVASARRAAAAGSTGDADAAEEQEPRGGRRGHTTPADVVAALQEDPRGRRGGTRPPRTGSEDGDPAAPAAARAEVGAEPMTAQELCEAAGITADLLAGLEDYGLVAATTVAGVSSYDAEALAVATVARRYAELGVEPRHLRMYKVAAEREAGIIEQMVVPLLKQRNPEARERAAGRADELLQLGAQLHGALLRRKLGPVLGS